MEVFIGRVMESKKTLGSFFFERRKTMKTRIDDLYQYNILLDKEDMDRLRENGVISIDTHLEIPWLTFIHIIATKDLKDELEKEE